MFLFVMTFGSVTIFHNHAGITSPLIDLIRDGVAVAVGIRNFLSQLSHSRSSNHCRYTTSIPILEPRRNLQSHIPSAPNNIFMHLFARSMYLEKVTYFTTSVNRFLFQACCISDPVSHRIPNTGPCAALSSTMSGTFPCTDRSNPPCGIF